MKEVKLITEEKIGRVCLKIGGRYMYKVREGLYFGGIYLGKDFGFYVFEMQSVEAVRQITGISEPAILLPLTKEEVKTHIDVT